MTAIPKFTEGDKVKILDGSKIPDYAGGWDGIIMKEFIGKTVTIVSPIMDLFNKGMKAYQLESNVDELKRCAMYIWDERGLELVEPKPEPKFKPGDIVEILFGDSTGKIDTVKESWVGKIHGRWYKLNERNLINYKEDELRLVEPKFKIGDCVKILDGIGNVYRISEVTIKNDKIAYILDGFKDWIFDECGLEIIPTKYKAGDKVKIINDFGISRKYVGKIFEVSSVHKIFEDGKVQYLLNGNGLKNYVVNESMLELVKENDIMMQNTNKSSLIKELDSEQGYIDVLLLLFGESRVIWFYLMNAVKNLWRYKYGMDEQGLTKARKYYDMSVLSSNADNEETKQIREIKGRIKKLLNECDG